MFRALNDDLFYLLSRLSNSRNTSASVLNRLASPMKLKPDIINANPPVLTQNQGSALASFSFEPCSNTAKPLPNSIAPPPPNNQYLVINFFSRSVLMFVRSKSSFLEKPSLGHPVYKKDVSYSHSYGPCFEFNVLNPYY